MNAVAPCCGRLTALAAMAALLMAGKSAPAASGLPVAAGPSGLTIEQLLEIAHPGPPVWSPRGDRIAFVRQIDSAVDLWWTTQQHDEPVPVTREAGADDPGAVSGFVWTPSGEALLYVLRGNLYRYDVVAGSRDELIADGSLSGAPAVTTDGLHVALVRNGQPWVGSFPELEGTVLVDSDGSFRELVWSPDGRFLAALHSATERIVEDTAALMGDKVEFVRHDTTPVDLVVIDVDDGSVTWL